MRKISLHTTWFKHISAMVYVLALVLVLAGCQMEWYEDYKEPQNDELLGKIEAGSSSLMFTRAPANDGDILNRVKTLRILIFDAVTGQLVRYSTSEGVKLNNERFPASGIFADEQAIEINLTTSPGSRHIYFVANEDSDTQLAAALSSNSLTRTQLLGLTASYNPNVAVDGETPFLMTGSISSLLIKPYSTSELVVELKRTFSKVTVQFTMDESFATALTADAPNPSTVATPKLANQCYTKSSAPSFVSIDEISIQVPQKYYLFNAIPHTNQAFVDKSRTSTRTTKSGTWVFGKRQYYWGATWNSSVTPFSLSYSHETARECTAVFYVPEYIAQDPLNETAGLQLSFTLSRRSYTDPTYPTGITCTEYPTYATSGLISYSMTAPAATSATRTYTTYLYTLYNSEEDPVYSLPRNHEYTVNASLNSWEEDAIRVRAGVKQWNQESIDLDIAPAIYDWGYWLNESAMTPFGNPLGEQAAGTVKYMQTKYFGLRLSAPMGKNWRISLSDAYSFEFTEDSQTQGLISSDATGVYYKFGVKPVFPYNSMASVQTEIRIIVDNMIVDQGRYNLTQIE